jgi:cytochrome c
MRRFCVLLFAGALAVLPSAALAQGNVARGEQLYRNCMACHSLEPKKNLTGPSLSGLFGREAGTLESFSRYSEPLKSSHLVWNDNSLDAWLADPQQVVPGNQMTFPGIDNRQARADIIAFLKQATKPGAQTAQTQPRSGMGGMGGMMSNTVPNLKTLDNATRVSSVQYCRDSYEIVTADGKKRKIWERNLRFKTDSSADGPTKGAPALVPAAMMGDRADVILATPDEFGSFVAQKC